MTLEECAVGIAPGTASDVVDVAGVAYRHDEGGCLDVMELLDIACKDIDGLVSDASEDDTFNVTFFATPAHFFLEPSGELVIGEVADSHEGTIGEGQGLLVGYL